MSWLEKLYETYDQCVGQEQFESNPLPPISHVEQQAHLEIVLDGNGAFQRALLVPKEPTLVPVTEQSAGRTSGAVAHPLCDKVKYLARDYLSPFGEESVHHLYLQQLRSWVAVEQNLKLLAILKYVEKGEIVKDLVGQKLLWEDETGKLITEWQGDSPPIARLLSPDAKTKKRDQGDAFVRWRVELDDDLESAVWRDPQLHAAWMRYDALRDAEIGLCVVTGELSPLASNHPKKLRHSGDGAKLISSNDTDGFTFRGRFDSASEAYGVAAIVTQKAHSALRWLIARRQGSRQGDQVIVSWSVGGWPTPPVPVSTEELLLGEKADEPQANGGHRGTEIYPSRYVGDVGQSFSSRLNKLIRGYEAQLGDHDDIIVLALDSPATTIRRISITYYRELHSSEFLDRVQSWHEKMAWPQKPVQRRYFVGAPAPGDIAKAAYGRQSQGKNGVKLLTATVGRLLPCIVDARPIPLDLMHSCVNRTVGRAALKRLKSGCEEEFEFCLGITCSMLKGSRPEEEYKMSLEENRTTRSYLYGRLLAVAESLERFALDKAGETRDTSAGRYMNRFADRPFETWLVIVKHLKPYESRLRNNPRLVSFLEDRQRLLAHIGSLFESDDFTVKKARLDGEFLLGYYCQRERLWEKRKKNGSGDEQQNNQGEGDIE